MATEVVKTIKPSGGDYSSLQAFMLGEARNLVTANEIAVAEVYAMADTTAVTITGFTTDATRYVEVRPASGEEHPGYFTTSKYYLDLSAENYAIRIEDNYVRIKGIQINNEPDNYGSYDHGIILVPASTSEIQISKCIIKAYTPGTWFSDCWGITYAYSSGTHVWKIWDNIFIDYNGGTLTTSGAIRVKYATAYIYNNTFVRCYTGIDNFGTIIAKNNLFYDCALPGVGTFAVGTDYNATDKSSMNYTVTSSGNTHDRLSQTFTFTSASNFHLASNDAGALTYGTDLSADGNLAFDDDIDGDARPSSWSIGFDDIASALALAANNALSMGMAF